MSDSKSGVFKKRQFLKDASRIYQSLVDNSNDAIMLLDEEGFFDCNLATVKLFGCKDREHFCSFHPRDLSPEIQPDGISSAEKSAYSIKKALTEGHHNFEWVHKRMDGTHFKAEVTLSAFEVSGMWVLQAYVKDVTEQVKVKEELEEKNSYIQAMLDAIPGFVSWINQDYTYLGVNNELAGHFGVPASDFRGRPIGFKKNFSRPNLEELCRMMFNSDNDFYQEEVVVDTERLGPRNFILTLRKFNQGKGIIMIGIDNTELKKTQIQLALEQEKAVTQAKFASLGEMTAGIGHEISNPLSIMDGYLKRITRRAPEEIKEDVDRTIWALDRVEKIVQGLKRIARNDENDQKKWTSLKLILDDTMAFTSAKLKRSGVNLEVSEYDSSMQVLCRHVQLCQVLLNLIVNAKDAVEGLDRKWVRLEFEQNKNHTLIHVIDSGEGVPSNLNEKVFNPLYTTKAEGKGTGIGLSLSRKIITSHGGELFINNEHSHSCFTIKLPNV